MDELTALREAYRELEARHRVVCVLARKVLALVGGGGMHLVVCSSRESSELHFTGLEVEELRASMPRPIVEKRRGEPSS